MCWLHWCGHVWCRIHLLQHVLAAGNLNNPVRPPTGAFRAVRSAREERKRPDESDQNLLLFPSHPRGVYAPPTWVCLLLERGIGRAGRGAKMAGELPGRAPFFYFSVGGGMSIVCARWITYNGP